MQRGAAVDGKSMGAGGDESRRLKAARLQLARTHVSAGGRLRDTLQEVLVIAATALRVDRVGVWLLQEGAKRSIRCHLLYQPAAAGLYSGVLLHERDFPNYFRAIEARRLVALPDVWAEVEARELWEPYLRPLAIGALLDAPVYRGGRVAGVVCHEHIGGPRGWSEREGDFAVGVAETVSRLMEEAERRKAENSLEAYQQRALEIQRMEGLGQLAAGIAHDFRNVLTTFVGYADILQIKAEGQAEFKKMARGLRSAAVHGQALVDELLAYGQEKLVAPAVLDPAARVEAFEKMARMAVGRRVRLTTRAERPVGRVFMDPAQLERALLNLVVNARDAMPDGGTVELSVGEATVERGAGPRSREGRHVLVAVKDEGTGMGPETLARVFDPFFTTKGKKGTGLGLAIVQQIVTAAGGFVEVSSEPGRGSTFRVYLPMIAGA